MTLSWESQHGRLMQTWTVSGSQWDLIDGARILVVDDDQMAVRSLNRVLRDYGAEVRTAMSLADAKRAIEAEGPYETAVVDFFLVGEEGKALISPLREASTCSLMISGVEREQVARAAISSGADDFLLKPFQVDEFLDAVCRTIERTREWRSILEPITQGQRPPRRDPKKPVLQSELDRIAQWLQKQGKLSDRERDVILMVFMGRSNEEIAARFDISESTVKYHDLRGRRKLGVEGRRELTRLVFDGVEPSE